MSRAFILGSGFSTYAGAPISRSVLPAIFNGRSKDPALLKLENFLGQFLFKGAKNWIKNSDLEEVLSRLDLIQHYKPYSHVDYNHVLYFEELLLKEFINLLTPEYTEEEHQVYRNFGKLINTNDTIISFNYDLIVENLLKSSGKYHNYCIETPKSPGGVDLLKLHGSINLYYCPDCGTVRHFTNLVTHPLPGNAKNSSTVTEVLICHRCSSEENTIQLRHFIIAPTLFKSYSLPVLRNLWFKALQALIKAEEIYFIGYSMPEADILSYQLFDFGRKLAQSRQEVHLVNGPNLSPRRFKQIYGPDLKNTGLYLDKWLDKKKAGTT